MTTVLLFFEHSPTIWHNQISRSGIPALESAATLKSPGFFSWDCYLKAEIWELSVLIAFGVPLLPGVARVREYVYLPLCTCIQTFASIFVSVFIHIYIYDKMNSH